ncbi:MAG: DUF89 family protein, partial [Nitrospirae bacterium]|nr:DUF89 family protein [Nitrospirota bacterium]
MFRQTIMTLDRVDISEELKMDCMFQVAEQVRIADPDKTPAHITTFIYRKIMEYAKNDPYRIVKLQYNKIAMGLMPELSKLINDSHDPLWTASRIAIAGNIIDFGLFKEFDIGAIIKRSLQPKVAVDEYQRFKEYINNNKK